eukprot:COSAG02_NODE_5799_length_4028_cov_6.713413_5_plen_58_part_00
MQKENTRTRERENVRTETLQLHSRSSTFIKFVAVDKRLGVFALEENDTTAVLTCIQT